MTLCRLLFFFSFGVCRFASDKIVYERIFHLALIQFVLHGVDGHTYISIERQWTEYNHDKITNDNRAIFRKTPANPINSFVRSKVRYTLAPSPQPYIFGGPEKSLVPCVYSSYFVASKNFARLFFIWIWRSVCFFFLISVYISILLCDFCCFALLPFDYIFCTYF